MNVLLAISRACIAVVAAAALLADCSASRLAVGAPPISQSFARAASSDLLYVTNNNNTVTVYSYPAGTLVATIENSKFDEVEGACADAAGNVFITDWGAGEIIEYAHGQYKTPKATLSDENEHPQGCAVDPKTGNLAVASYGNTHTSDSGGDLAIYVKAAGSPKIYADRSIYRYFYCAYDDSGDLFVDGQAPESDRLQFAFAELLTNHRFKTISLSQTIAEPGGVQWYGKDVVVGDSSINMLYEFAISGSSGTLRRRTRLKDASDVVGFTIYHSSVILADHGNDNVQVYSFPLARKPTTTITDGIDYPNGVALSLATP